MSWPGRWSAGSSGTVVGGIVVAATVVVGIVVAGTVAGGTVVADRGRAATCARHPRIARRSTACSASLAHCGQVQTVGTGVGRVGVEAVAPLGDHDSGRAAPGGAARR